jgi:maltooligosyltrehalose trehalohydrolase
MSHLWALDRGAQLLPDNSVRFTLWAPRLRLPRLRVLSGPAQGDHALAPIEGERDVYSATVPNVGVDADYAFVTDDGRTLPDPVSRWQPEGVHAPSRVVDPAAFSWTDDGWRGVMMDELVIYEIHVGTFTPAGTFEAIIPRLTELKSLGVTAIELMPIAQFPGTRNWGYDGVAIYAAQNSYGGPSALKALVDAAHATGLGVLLDVVYNHIGPEGNYLEAFGPYFTDKYTTPWGRALNYDDMDSDEVRRFAIDNALYWVTEFHVDGLRLDAVHGIFDFSARHLIEELTTAVHTQGDRLGRSVVVIAESDLNDPRLLRSADENGLGLDGQWSDDFHHAVHALLTGDRNGYYADFGPASAIADALREPFVLAGRYSTYRRRKHGAASTGIPRRRFVVAIQNHDQVGNRAIGDRLSVLVSPAQLRLAAALMILSPYVPLLFMGEEYGETNPFQYFINHGDEHLVAAVRDGRLREFESFGWGKEVPDAQNDGTFQRSKLDWSKAEREDHRALLTLYRDLLTLRREESMLRPDGSTIDVSNGDPGWIALVREPADLFNRYHAWEYEALLTLFNCSDQSVDVPVPGSSTRAWSLRLSTDAPGYGGNGDVASSIDSSVPTDGPKRLIGADRIRGVRLPPWSAAVFAAMS